MKAFADPYLEAKGSKFVFLLFTMKSIFKVSHNAAVVSTPIIPNRFRLPINVIAAIVHSVHELFSSRLNY